MTQLLTAAEVAETLAVSPDTVLRLARRGKIKAVRVGPKLVRFTPAAVEQYILGATECARRGLDGH